MATTTLTNGTKIPERASRDWYSDLSTNWYLLDNHLGDTGSHLDEGLAPKATADADGNTITSTYATKTELSTLSNTVGTKANDSDVVHKADAETITGAKTFSATVTSADVVPSATDTYSLGSASVQYNGIYGKSYFYNGTQWGLDVANEWSKRQSLKQGQNFVIDTVEMGVTPSANKSIYTHLKDKNNVSIGWVGWIYTTSGNLSVEMLVSNAYKDGALDPTGTQQYRSLNLTIDASGTSYVSWSGYVNNNIIPLTNNAYDLGSSSNKWKTLNGINPGALSLPSTDNAVSLDTTNVSMDGTYTYVPISVNGWLYVGLRDTLAKTDGEVTFYMKTPGMGGTYAKWAVNFECSSDGYVRCFIPVLAGSRIRVRVNPNDGSPVSLTMVIFPCLGNV